MGDRSMLSRFTVALLALGCAALALAGPAAAQAQTPDQVMRVDLSSGPAKQRLSLPRSKSAIIELPVDARDVLVSDPKVADVVLRTPRRLYVLGISAGQTDAVFFDHSGRQILSVDIRVDADVSALEDTLRKVLPGTRLEVQPAADGLILTGIVANAGESDRAQKIAERFVARPDLIINALAIAGKEQVMLKVRIIEVQRSVIKQLGVDLNAVLNQIGEVQYGFRSLATFGINGALLGGASGGYSVDTTKNPFINPVFCPPAGGNCTVQPQVELDREFKLAGIRDGAGSNGLNKAETTIKAFERVGLIRTLAEPNLTAISGEAANFLAGGEFPIPVTQDAATNAITVTYKPFGVALGFTPVVMSEGRISLRLSTEVSELSSIGAFTTNGFSVPGLSVRRAETTVELPSGGSLMIAGLLQENLQENLDKIPGAASLPVLGALFRSRDFQNRQSELVVLVTPYLVDSTSASRLQTPADGLTIASDARTIFLGQLNTAYRPAAGPAAGAAYQGPVGPVIE